MSERTFMVSRSRLVPVTTYERQTEVLLETDDWLEAEQAYSAAVPAGSYRVLGWSAQLDGVHPSHTFKAKGHIRECATCGAPDNGCYRSHAPCGFNRRGRSLSQIIEDERETTLVEREV